MTGYFSMQKTHQLLALFCLGDVQAQALVVFRLGQDGFGEAYLHPEGEAFGAFREGGAAGDGDVCGLAGREGGEDGFGVQLLAVVVGVGEGDCRGGQGGVAVIFYMEESAACQPLVGRYFRRGIGSGV